MKEKVLHISSVDNNEVNFCGFVVPQDMFSMFTLFLADKVYKCPIKYVLDNEKE